MVFLNRPLGQSPEDDLLLQVQGIVAEYERAKIMERSRRGKKHAAQSGSLNVMSGAPFGYRYVSVSEAGGQARFEPVAKQARIVRQIFSWIGQDRCSLAEVCRRLQKAGELTATGKPIWSRQAVWHVLQNPAYQGQAAYGKTHMMPRGKNARLRAARGRPAEPRRSNAPIAADPKEWVFVSVPPLIDPVLFRAAHTQLEENRSRARLGRRRVPLTGTHLLRKMRLRLLRQDDTPIRWCWSSNERLSILPLRWVGWVSVWRRTHLQQGTGPGRVSGESCVAPSIRTAEKPREVGTRISRP